MFNRIMKFGALLTIIASALMMVSCLFSEGNQSSDAASSANLKTVRIGLMSDVGAVPFLLAQEQGLFDDYGLDVQITVFKSAVERDTAIQTGNLDGAMSDMLAAIMMNSAGFDVQMTSSTYGVYKLVTSPQLNSQTITELDVIKVGISSNTVIDFATDIISENQGLSDKFETVAIPQMPVRLEMLKAGELNAATLPEPLATAAMLNGGEVVAQTEKMDLYPGIFLFTNEFIADNSDVIASFYKAYNEAVAYVNNKDTDEHMDLYIEKLSFPTVLKGKFTLPVFKPISAADVYTFETVAQWAVNRGLVPDVADYTAITDSTFLP